MMKYFLLVVLSLCFSINAQTLEVPGGVIEEPYITDLTYTNNGTWGWVKIRCTAIIGDTLERVVFDEFFIIQREGAPVGTGEIGHPPPGTIFVDIETIAGHTAPWYAPTISVPVVP